jgi:hypothetical protein
MPARDLSELDVAAVTARDTLIASMPVLNDSNKQLRPFREERP